MTLPRRCSPAPARRRHRGLRATSLTGLTGVAALLAATALAGCGAAASSDPGDTAAAGMVTVPALADLEAAADPRSHVGALDVDLPPAEIEPVDATAPPALPVTVTDAQGTEVTVTDTSRILALDIYGTLAETVFQLGLGDQVVGRDVSSQFAEVADRPLVTRNGHDLNAEAILALDPSVVLTDTSLGPWDAVLQLRDAGVPVVVTDSHRSLDNVGPLTQQVADALGVPERGAALTARLDSEVAAAQSEVARLTPADLTGRLRTIFLYARGQAGVYYLFGEGSGADALIEAAGGYDVSEEIGWSGMKPVNDEGLVAAQPDAIVMMREGLESVGGVEGLLERFPALAQTPAGEHRRVIAMDDDQVLGFGPRTASVISALAAALYAPEGLVATEPAGAAG